MTPQQLEEDVRTYVDGPQLQGTRVDRMVEQIETLSDETLEHHVGARVELERPFPRPRAPNGGMDARLVCSMRLAPLDNIAFRVLEAFVD